MAKSQQHKSPPVPPTLSQGQLVPQTVLAVKSVELVLVSYMDEENKQMTTLAVVGDNLVHILEGRNLGFSTTTTRQGVASKWLRDGIFQALGRPVPKEA